MPIIRCRWTTGQRVWRLVLCAISTVALLTGAADLRQASSGDWPMWRYDAGRTGASPHALPDNLKLVWSRQELPRVPTWDDPLNQDLMPYDRQFEPVVAGGRMFLGYNDSDKVVALDARTGKELWTFYTNGPVRMPPAAARDKVYFASDDGCLYCVRAADGTLVWKHRGGPTDRRILGNRRLISTWPARGAPVVAGEVVYYAASIWPFMGTYVYALNADTGAEVWVNDSSHAAYIDQPHNSPSFAGVAPQGPLALSGDVLVVPGGRSVPAGFDRKTGKQLYFHLAKYSKAGGSWAFALSPFMLAHERQGEFSVYELTSGQKYYEDKIGQPVMAGEVLYTSGTRVKALSYKSLKKVPLSKKLDVAGRIKRGLSKLGNADSEDDDDEHEADGQDSKEKPNDDSDSSKSDSSKSDSGKSESGSDEKSKSDGGDSSKSDAKSSKSKRSSSRRSSKSDGKSGEKSDGKDPKKNSSSKDSGSKDSKKTDGKDAKKKSPAALTEPVTPVRWTARVDASGDLIMAGGRLYAGGQDQVTVLESAVDGKSAKIVDKLPVPGKVARLVAADGMLFVVTLEGQLLAFGNGPPATVAADTSNGASSTTAATVAVTDSGSATVHTAVAVNGATAVSRAAQQTAEQIVQDTGVSAGYAVSFGAPPIDMLRHLSATTELHTIVIERDAAKIRRLREALDQLDLYGDRVAIYEADPSTALLPPLMASLAFVGDETVDVANAGMLRQVYHVLRPYGGRMWLTGSATQRAAIGAAVQTAKLVSARTYERGAAVVVERAGPLPGAGSWTHQYSDPANTIKSEDQLVKLPLGLLWFGGPSNEDVLPRHGHGPPPLVIGGRLFVQGADSISARDVYTGRILWRAFLPGLDNYGLFIDETYKYTPLSTSYNQVHIPGANARGTNYVATADRVYVAEGEQCRVLDAETGKTLTSFRISPTPRDPLPPEPQFDWTGEDKAPDLGPPKRKPLPPEPDDPKKPDKSGDKKSSDRKSDRSDRRRDRSSDSKSSRDRSSDSRSSRDRRSDDKSADKKSEGKDKQADAKSKDKPAPDPAYEDPARSWAYIGVYEGLLIGGDGFTTYSTPALRPKKDPKSKYRFQDYDRSASQALVVMDRITGEVKWRIRARYGFLHNGIAIGDGTLYAIDKLPPYLQQKLKRRGKATPRDFRLLAIDLKTGDVRWETSTDVFGSWLGYSTEHKALLQSTRPSRDMLLGEEGARMILYDAVSGKPRWSKDLKYDAPPILHNDWIICGSRAFQLKDGEVVMREEPLTGRKIPWSYTRAYGCNYPVACENLLTFRSAAAGFFDLAGDGGVGNLGGFKSSCSSNLVAADGVLNAPDYTRTCSCSYQNQTSLALIHMPELEMWTGNDFAFRGGTVKRVGVNFGAAGDRRAEEGTLWLEFPSRGAPSPKLPIEVKGQGVEYYQHSAARFGGNEGFGWVASSGVRGPADISITLNDKYDPTLAGGIKIAAKSDDAEEDAKGKVRIDSGDLELTEDTSRQTVGLRFTKLDIPPGSKIEEAYIQFKAQEAQKQTSTIAIHGQDADDAATFEDKDKNVSARPTTKTSVAWTIPAWAKSGEADKPQRTPNLAPLVQSIVDRKGWKANNAVALIFTGKGKHSVKSFDGEAGAAPTLFIKLLASSESQKKTAEQKPGDKKPDAKTVSDKSSADKPPLPPGPAKDSSPNGSSPANGSSPTKAFPASTVSAKQSGDSAKLYTVRLYFAEPASVAPGERTFDVMLQGQKVLEHFDIVQSAGGPHRCIIREFTGVPVSGKLLVQLRPTGKQPPLLAGIEAVAQSAN